MEAIFYVEPYFEESCNKAIVENYRFIKERFELKKIPFIYLPKLLSEDSFNRIMDYNHPYFKNYDKVDPAKIYPLLIKHYDIISERPALVYVSDRNEEVVKVDIDEEELSTYIEEISDKIHRIKTEIQLREVQKPRFRCRSVDRVKNVLFEYENDADENFNTDAFEIPDDLRKKIYELREAGYLSKLIEFLEELQKTTRKLSRLQITNDYKIYLMDYDMKEVKMSPLPKALYLLFLNHPEGILFKELPVYRNELMTIYKNISLRENPDEARESIYKMTDPFDNSVNEKCSRIRAAFLSVFSDDIAENYYITGSRGNTKKILLDRELVVYKKKTISQGL